MTSLLERMSSAREGRPTPQASGHARRATLLALVLVLLGQGLVLGGVDVPVLTPLVALALLVGLPVWVLVVRADWGDDPIRRLVLSVATVVGGVLLGALLLDVVLPPLSISRPLARGPVGTASTVVDLALVCWRRQVPLLPAPAATVRRWLLARLDPAVGVALLALVLGVVGAVRLNNGASASVATDGHLMAGLAMVVALVAAGRGGASRDALVVYLSGLGLLLATSLRGWVIVGHDIQQEFIVFTAADGPARWSPSALNGAYNACLSLNVLPVAVSQYTGLSGVVVFKVLGPVLFALVPVGVLAWSARFVERRTALLAAIVTISFPTFFTDMPYLVRQEVAFFFLVAALLVGQEVDWRLRNRRVMVALFGVLVVLSHYSTTYLMLMALMVAAVGVPMGRAWGRWRRNRRDRKAGRPANYVPERPNLALAHPAVVAVLIAVTYLWTVPITNSGGHLFDTIAQTAAELTDGSGGPASSDLAYGLFASKQATPRQRLDMFVAETLQQRAADGGQGYLINRLGPPELEPAIIDPPNLPTTPVGRALDTGPLDAGVLNSLSRTGSAAVLQLALLFGMALLLLRRGGTSRFGPEVRWLCLGVLVTLGVQIVIPGLSADYGVLRAFQQSLLVVAPVLAVGLVSAASVLRRWARTRGLVWPALGGVVALLFLALTGTAARLTGGYPGQLALGDSGQYYDLYYQTPSQVDALNWVRANSRGQPVQSQEVSIDLAGSNEFYPTQLRQGSWVYLTGQNVTKDQATVFYTGNLITYAYPVGVLSDTLSLVYSTDRAQVYR